MKNLITILTFFIIAISCSKFSGTNLSEEIKLIPFENSDKKIGYFNLDGNIVINPQFKAAFLFSEDYSVVRNSEDKYGYINETGNFIVNPQYKYATNFHEKLAFVVLPDGKCQFIDYSGKIVFVLENAEKCGVFNEGLAWIKQDKKFGFIDKLGTIVIQPQFDSVQVFSEGLCPVLVISNTDKNWGYINVKGEIVINPQFRSAYSFNEGLAVVSDGSNIGYIDKSGKYLINPQFTMAVSFQNDMAVFKQGDQFGFIDKTGKIVINPQFSSANNFSNNGLALVKSGEKYGYINREGKFVINPQFENATKFFGNVAFAGNGNKYGIIDNKGKYKVNPQFDIFLDEFIFYSFGKLDYSFVLSDYFDKGLLINSIIEGSTEKTFKNLSPEVSYEELKAKHNTASQYLREVQNWAVMEAGFDMGKYAKCNKINYRFDGMISEQVPIYRTQQKYNYYQGGYVNEEVLDHYESKVNDGVKLTLAAYFIELKDKARGRGKEIAKALIDEFKLKIGGTINETYFDKGNSAEAMPMFEICDSSTFPGCIKVGYKESEINVWADFAPGTEE